MDMFKHIKPLNSEAEWPLWKHKIRDLLDYHEGALDLIDGKLIKPDPLENGATEDQRKAHKEKCEFYRKSHSYAKSMIASAVSDAIYQKIMDKETAKDAWDALKVQFEATSKDQLFKICTDFFALSWVTSQDVSTHIAKLTSLWNQLNNGLKARNEETLSDLIIVCKTLHILPSNFETFKPSWILLTKDDERTFDELTTQLLCMFERNFKKVETNSELSQDALVVKANNLKQTNNSSYYKNKSCSQISP